MLEIGKTYLDRWGTPHKVWGHTRTGHRDNEKVYTSSAHYWQKTGKVDGHGPQLINIKNKRAELKDWQDFLILVRSNNSADKLAIPTIAEGIKNIEDRIEFLKKELARK